MAAALKRARPTPDVDAYQRAWKRRQQAAGITAFPTKRDALEYADAHQHELVVALDKLVAPGAKVCEFATCCDVPDFLRRTASLSPRHFYEIVRAERPRYHYADVEIEAGDIGPTLPDPNTVRAAVTAFFADVFQTVLGVHAQEPTVTTASTDAKVSLHLVWRAAGHFRDHDTHHKPFIDAAWHLLLTHPGFAHHRAALSRRATASAHARTHRFMVDFSVYQRDKQMRTLGSTKAHSTRVLRKWDAQAALPDTDFFITNVHPDSTVLPDSAVPHAAAPPARPISTVPRAAARHAPARTELPDNVVTHATELMQQVHPDARCTGSSKWLGNGGSLGVVEFSKSATACPFKRAPHRSNRANVHVEPHTLRCLYHCFGCNKRAPLPLPTRQLCGGVL